MKRVILLIYRPGERVKTVLITSVLIVVGLTAGCFGTIPEVDSNELPPDVPGQVTSANLSWSGSNLTVEWEAPKANKSFKAETYNVAVYAVSTSNNNQAVLENPLAEAKKIRETNHTFRDLPFVTTCVKITSVNWKGEEAESAGLYCGRIRIRDTNLVPGVGAGMMIAVTALAAILVAKRRKK